ncbi:MAG: peptide chain release factor N(5)-glutamine methyltransferase, partial [Aeromonas veronii]
VSPATLIPRPDTEVLVEQALTRIPQGPCAVLDLGTGTGAIALALKSERPEIDVWAVDRMADAAALARENSVALGLPIEVRDGSWFEPLGEPDRDETPRFAVIVSNPPYIDGADPHLEQGDVRFEPRSALVADDAGLADIRHIVAHAPAYLLPDGWLLLEHGWDQGEAVRQLLRDGGYREVATVREYGDNDRVTLGLCPLR